MKLNQSKAIHALRHIIKSLPETHEPMWVYSLLYLAEKLHIKRYGVPITGDTYIAHPFGPFPMFSNLALVTNPNALEDTNLDVLTRSELESLNDCIAQHRTNDWGFSNPARDSAFHATPDGQPIEVEAIERAAHALPVTGKLALKFAEPRKLRIVSEGTGMDTKVFIGDKEIGSIIGSIEWSVKANEIAIARLECMLCGVNVSAVVPDEVAAALLTLERWQDAGYPASLLCEQVWPAVGMKAVVVTPGSRKLGDVFTIRHIRRVSFAQNAGGFNLIAGDDDVFVRESNLAEVIDWRETHAVGTPFLVTDAHPLYLSNTILFVPPTGYGLVSRGEDRYHPTRAHVEVVDSSANHGNGD